MTMRPILLLKDYRGHFYSSVRQSRVSMRIDQIAQGLRTRGYELEVQEFAQVDLDADYTDRAVLYHSAEDRGLKYKSFIEDVVLALSLKGARLLPPFPLLRAHHNKSFMELLRTVSGWDVLRNVQGRPFGTLEEFLADPLAADAAGPIVLKASDGTQSQGVLLARTAAEKRRIAKRLSATAHVIDDGKDVVKRIVRSYHVAESSHRGKFVAQPFVQGLGHDYKLLVYGDRVFVLQRSVRPGDFRASGSGLFAFPEQPDRALLEFGIEFRERFDVPFVSLDVGFDGRTLFVFEFQFVSFGTTTLERSTFHFQRSGADWDRVEGKADLEDVFAESVVRYLETKRPTPLANRG